MKASDLSAGRGLIAILLMMASGFAGLSYQIIWAQQSALWLGHESAAVLAVVAAFFGGLAVGAYLLNRRVDSSPRPAAWYAGCEAVIGLWGLFLLWLLPAATNTLLDLMGPLPSAMRQWSITFLGTFLLLLPATAAMGATLPAMEAALTAEPSRGGSIGWLYAANTFGAVLGVTLTALLLLPAFGLTATVALSAVVNLVCALTATLFLQPRASARPATQPTSGANTTLLVLAVTGTLGIGFEVLGVRVLSQVTENTVYTFAILLAVYLVGTTLGAALYSRWLSGRPRAETFGERVTMLLALSCIVACVPMATAVDFQRWGAAMLGSSMASALIVEAALATACFLPATILMGAQFSHLATRARQSGVGLGRALAVNTAGAALAPLLFGVLLVPAFGLKMGVLLIATGYIILASAGAWRRMERWGLAVVILAVMTLTPEWNLVDVPSGSKVVSHKQGVLAAVSVIEHDNGVSTLHINNREQEGSNATLPADARQGVLPILLHPAPRRALFLGLGTGVTSWAATEDPRLQVDVIELIPEVVAASKHFVPREFEDARGPRRHVIGADARRYVRSASQDYDVIVADNYHPARSGTGALYTVEHFEFIRQRLSAHGLFCQWLPLHQIDQPTLRSIVRSFLQAFPGAWAMLATNSLDTPVLGLVATADGGKISIEQIRARLRTGTVAQNVARYGIDDDLAVLGSFVGGASSLAKFAHDAPLNTDDHPIVSYLAPRFTYAPDSRPRDRLIALLSNLTIRPDELLDLARDRNEDARIAAYWSARNAFILAGRDVRPTADVHAMLAQVRAPLLAVLRTSPDFRPAYDPLLRMAAALSQVDRMEGGALLAELRAIQPSRPEASRMLHELESNPVGGASGPR